MHYRSQGPTPLFNTPAFPMHFGGEDGSSLPLINSLLKTVETIIFPNTSVSVVNTFPNSYVAEVHTKAYPYSGRFYTDIRFLEKIKTPLIETPQSLPAPSTILQELDSLLGTRYIWGGTWPSGIPHLLTWYPPKTPLTDPLIQDTWVLRGLDCSGLLYKVTNGYTPRNTSLLIPFGQPVPIEGLSIKQIQAQLQPLDLIVWQGHVICVKNTEYTIESLHGRGVIQSPLIERLTTVSETKKPANTYAPHTFVIRRFFKKSMD